MFFRIPWEHPEIPSRTREKDPNRITPVTVGVLKGLLVGPPGVSKLYVQLSFDHTRATRGINNHITRETFNGLYLVVWLEKHTELLRISGKLAEKFLSVQDTRSTRGT
jgi:hypothetical protein